VQPGAAFTGAVAEPSRFIGFEEAKQDTSVTICNKAPAQGREMLPVQTGRRVGNSRTY